MKNRKMGEKPARRSDEAAARENRNATANKRGGRSYGKCEDGGGREMKWR